MGGFMSEFLRTFDGLKSNTIFCMWTGDNPMSAQRIQALWSIYNNTGCPVALINQSNLQHWVHPDHPLHPAFPYLSATHKSDYLRVYFMHHYGGGYTDIKQTTTSWPQFFQKLQTSNAYALGYQELAHGIPHVSGELGDIIRSKHAELIGLCAFIFKKFYRSSKRWARNPFHKKLMLRTIYKHILLASCARHLTLTRYRNHRGIPGSQGAAKAGHHLGGSPNSCGECSLYGICAATRKGSGTVCNPNCRFDWIGFSVEDGTFLSEAKRLTDLRSSIGPTAGIEELGQGYRGKEPNDRNHNH
jgi:hypothetical protein